MTYPYLYPSPPAVRGNCPIWTLLLDRVEPDQDTYFVVEKRRGADVVHRIPVPLRRPAGSGGYIGEIRRGRGSGRLPPSAAVIAEFDGRRGGVPRHRVVVSTASARRAEQTLGETFAKFRLGEGEHGHGRGCPERGCAHRFGGHADRRRRRVPLLHRG